MQGDARQVIARAASGDDHEGLEIADDILATLAAHGLRIVGDGQAVIAGEVVTLRQAWEEDLFCQWHGRRWLDCDGDLRPVYVVEAS